MSKLNLRNFHPDLPPSGRWIRQRVLVPGDPHASNLVEVQLGARPDRRDWNPSRCAAKRKGVGDQCGRLPVRGRAVCAMHGVGTLIRRRNGQTLPPEVSGALGRIVRDGRRGTVGLQSIAAFFPALNARIEQLREKPDLLNLREDAIALTALRELVTCGELDVDADFVVKATSQLAEAKARTLRAKSAIEQARAVPAERVQDLVVKLVAIIQKFTAPEHEMEVIRELRLLGATIEGGKLWPRMVSNDLDSAT